MSPGGRRALLHTWALLDPVLGGVSSAPLPSCLGGDTGPARVHPSPSGCRGDPLGFLSGGSPTAYTPSPAPAWGQNVRKGHQRHVVCIFKVPEKRWKGSLVTVTMWGVFMWKVEPPSWTVRWKLPGVSSQVSASSSPPCSCLAHPTRGCHTQEGFVGGCVYSGFTAGSAGGVAVAWCCSWCPVVPERVWDRLLRQSLGGGLTSG